MQQGEKGRVGAKFVLGVCLISVKYVCCRSLIPMDDDEYWKGVSTSSRSAIMAAIGACGPPVITTMTPPVGGMTMLPWAGSEMTDRVIHELKRSLQVQCVRCAAPNAILRCAVCHRATYCTRDCHLADWGEHRVTCANGVPQAALNALAVICPIAKVLMLQD